MTREEAIEIIRKKHGDAAVKKRENSSDLALISVAKTIKNGTYRVGERMADFRPEVVERD